jgi:hypothetical protein
VIKANFISIYGRAHCAILTPGNIRSAFEATGVWPFNPEVVTAEMMAPSLEMSSKNQLPLLQASPIRAINSVMCQYLRDRTTVTSTTSPMAGPSAGDMQTRLGYDQDDPFVDTPSCAVETASYSGSSTAPQAGTTWQLPAPTRRLPQWQIAAKDALDALASTSAAFLVDESPLTSAHQLPPFIPSPISPMRNLKQKYTLLADEPSNEKEAAYQKALLESQARDIQSKAAMVGMQSTIVLQGLFCERLSSQLAGQEDKQKKRKKGQLNGDGLPRLLTGDDFYNHVAEHERTSAIEEAAQEA